MVYPIMYSPWESDVGISYVSKALIFGRMIATAHVIYEHSRWRVVVKDDDGAKHVRLQSNHSQLSAALKAANLRLIELAKERVRGIVAEATPAEKVCEWCRYYEMEDVSLDNGILTTEGTCEQAYGNYRPGCPHWDVLDLDRYIRKLQEKSSVQEK